MQPFLLKAVFDSSHGNLSDVIYENKPIELNKVNTDKVYLDSQGNLRYSNNTDQMTQDLIDKITTNVGCVKVVEVKENKE